MEIEEIVKGLLECKKINSNSYMAKCPAHNDKRASLSIKESNEKILIHCFAGCKTEDIVKRMGLTMKDLFREKYENKEKNKRLKIEAEYIYVSENGDKLYKVIRYNPKRFIQARFNNNSNNWDFNMNGVQYVLYNLPNVIKTETIYFVEGEKDADNLNKLGLVATTTVGGASSFNKHALEYTKYLKDKTVYIIPDNDKAGYKYADDIKKALDGFAKTVKILKIKNEIRDLKEKADISDVLKKYGKEKTLEILKKLQVKEYKEDIFPINSANELNADNFSKILDYLGIKIRFNVITKRISVEGMPKKYADSDVYNILPIYLKDILRNNGIKVNTNIIEEYILLEISKNNFNPFIDFLTSNKWDGNDRITELFDIFNITDEFYKILFKKWLYQTVSIAFNNLDNPYGIDGVLTLQGGQGIGKTYSLSLLSPNPEWFQDGLTIDVNNKDSLIKATSALISEIGELDSTVKKEQSTLKAFLTSAVDDIRPPYGKKSIRRARNTSFCATVNPQSFLKDESGNRRFWVIPVEKIDYKRLETYGRDWILQLWLQIYYETKDNLQKFRLSKEEREKLNKSNLRFSEFLPGEEELLQKFNFDSIEKYRWTNQELIAKFNLNITPQILGKTLNKLKNIYPELIEIKRTSKGNVYCLPIKK